MSSVDRSAKNVMTVRQLAQHAGTTVHVVRNYLRRGLLRPARYSEGGYRLFSATELRRLQFVRTAQQLGFTLAEVEEIIRRSRRRQSPCPLVRDLIRRRLEDTGQQLEMLQALHRRIERAVTAWDALPDSVPIGDDVCGLIEAVAAVEGGRLTKPLPQGLPGRLRPSQ